jgi:hypothetical protein
MTEAPLRTFAPTMLAAWQAERKATRNPIIKKQCLQQAPELLPRFAEHYQQIRALRRRLRRSLQRQWKRSLPSVALLMALSSAGNGRDDQRGRDVYIGESHQCRQ